jgi:hypothetical protein
VPTSVVIESRRSLPTIPPGALPSKTSTTSRPLRRAQSVAWDTSSSSGRFGHCERSTLRASTSTVVFAVTGP